ncbi:hypothetical protein RS9917_09461 [Synechococcus sp. RS9917]|nr:hypothetical protein RS9917_09461 [Synechococcus sp. RS9917]
MMATTASDSVNPISNAVDQLAASVFPQASLSQLLLTLLFFGLIALLVGAPVARRRRHLQQFQNRVKEREAADQNPDDH